MPFNFHKLSRPFRDLIRGLISIEFTAILLFILIPVIIAGSFIPQDRTFAEYAHAYGIKLTEFFFRLYLTSIFTSPWFLVLVLLLGINVLGCFVKSFMEKQRSFGFFLVHVSLILLMVGGMVSALGRVRGEVILQEGQSVTSFDSNKKTIPLGFELRLKDFELQKYESRGEKLIVSMPGRKVPYEFSFRPNIWTAIPDTSYQFRIERSVLDFRFDMNTHTVFSASDEPNNPAVLVHVKGKDKEYTEWVFSMYSDFHNKGDGPLELRYVWAPSVPKAFISRVEILENGKVVKAQDIRVNKPLRYKGLSIYQASYDPKEEKWTGLEIVKDPGIGLVYFSIIVVMLGLIQNIYISPLLKKNKDRAK